MSNTSSFRSNAGVHAPLDADSIAGLGSAQLARLIDHTQLAPTAGSADIAEACEIALAHHTASVCVQPRWVPMVAEKLAGSEVKVCTVIGFPLGTTTAETKALETAQAVADGATEVDMVIAQDLALAHDIAGLEADIAAVVQAARDAPKAQKAQKAGKSAGNGVVVKVILETAALVDGQGNLDHDAVHAGCVAAERAGADFVKTSTGFGPGGATVEAVRLMRETVGDRLGVKASGGVRTREDAEKMLQAGATRLGASSTLGILG